MRAKSTHALQRALKRELQHQQWLRSNPALSAQARASQRTILKLYTVLHVARDSQQHKRKEQA